MGGRGRCLFLSRFRSHSRKRRTDFRTCRKTTFPLSSNLSREKVDGYVFIKQRYSNLSREEQRSHPRSSEICPQNVPLPTQKCGSLQYGARFPANTEDDFNVFLVTVDSAEPVECEKPCRGRVLIENWKGNKLNLCFRDAENESFAGRVRH